MKTRVRRPALLLVVGFLLFCSACNPSEIKKAKAASQTIARLVDTAIELTPTLQEQGAITESDARAVNIALRDLKIAIDEFNRRAAGYTKFDLKAKADLARAFSDVTAALATLNAEGVLHIKDPTLRGRIQIGLTTVNLAAQQIEALLNDE
jgi:hypothetical protein